MTVLRAKTALLADGWASDVEVTITDGRIAGLAAGRPGPGALGCLLPAPVNLHSHAFQRAMAGMTERRSAGQDHLGYRPDHPDLHPRQPAAAQYELHA